MANFRDKGYASTTNFHDNVLDFMANVHYKGWVFMANFMVNFHDKSSA